MTNSLQNRTVVSFNPNPNQVKFLEACLNPDVDPTITARCSYAGISRDTFYRWNQDPDFREWLTAKVEGFMKDELGEVWEATLREAKKGNVPAQKLFLERFDLQYIYRKRDSAGNKLSLSLTLNQDNRQYELTEERLRRIGVSLKEAEDGICC